MVMPLPVPTFSGGPNGLTFAGILLLVFPLAECIYCVLTVYPACPNNVKNSVYKRGQ